MSFCIALPFLLAALSSVVGLIAGLCLRTMLDIETFALARARLYGNEVSCSGGSLWGLAQPGGDIEVSFECPGTAQARGEFRWKGQIHARSEFDLEHGNFKR